jgi:hypothetical protein
VKLVRTCDACPTQYDVTLEEVVALLEEYLPSLGVTEPVR